MHALLVCTSPRGRGLRTRVWKLVVLHRLLCTISIKCRLDGFPVYEVPPEKYAAERIIKNLLDPKTDDRKICKQCTLNVESSSTF